MDETGRLKRLKQFLRQGPAQSQQQSAEKRRFLRREDAMHRGHEPLPKHREDVRPVRRTGARDGAREGYGADVELPKILSIRKNPAGVGEKVLRFDEGG